MTHQITQAGRMPAHIAVALLTEMIPAFHAKGQDHFVEAISEALDALDWSPLHTAPRDGTWVMLAIAPWAKFDLDGFVCIGRWITPPAGESLSKDKQRLLDANGGWWSSSRAEKPFRRPVLAWRPLPAVDFAQLQSRQADPAAYPELADDVAFAGIPVPALRAAADGLRSKHRFAAEEAAHG